MQSRLRSAMTTGSRAAAQSFMKDVISDVQGRLPCYRDDWTHGWSVGILGPAVYVFLASVVPALAFGVQIDEATGGVLTVVHVLTATAATGIVQAVLGGQPLLIVGVSEPIVLLYGYMYSFGSTRASLGSQLFLAWAAWVCVFAGILMILLSVTNSCRYANRFTRMSGEIFGMLIAILFMQEAIRRVLLEFRPDKTPGSESSAEANEFQWRLSNGLWGLLLAFGTTIAALIVQQARSWRYATDLFRSFLADYGVPLVVVAFSGLSYALKGVPEGIPRRIVLPNTWEVKTTWTVAHQMAQVPGPFIAGALIPAIMLTILFYFDHTVSSQLAQLPEFNLLKPPAYSYDLLLVGLFTIGCGLLGVPPVNGVLPQAPMHTKSLMILKKNNTLKALHKVADDMPSAEARQVIEAMGQRCQEVGAIKAAAVMTDSAALDHLRDEQVTAGIDIMKEVSQVLPDEAHESRITALIQALFLAGCLGITPGLRKIPTAVLWGYFAYLSLASLAGNDFWERFLQLFADPARWSSQGDGMSWSKRGASGRAMVAFTLFQVMWTGLVFGITWIPIAGIVFPVPILLLIPIRQYILPRVFAARNLSALDPATFEETQQRPGPDCSEMTQQNTAHINNASDDALNPPRDEALQFHGVSV